VNRDAFSTMRSAQTPTKPILSGIKEEIGEYKRFQADHSGLEFFAVALFFVGTVIGIAWYFDHPDYGEFEKLNMVTIADFVGSVPYLGHFISVVIAIKAALSVAVKVQEVEVERLGISLERADKAGDEPAKAMFANKKDENKAGILAWKSIENCVTLFVSGIIFGYVAHAFGAGVTTKFWTTVFSLSLVILGASRFLWIYRKLRDAYMPNTIKPNAPRADVAGVRGKTSTILLALSGLLAIGTGFLWIFHKILNLVFPKNADGNNSSESSTIIRD